MNLTCNSTLEELRILPTSEIAIAGSLTFHQLALIIAAAGTLVAIVLSLYLIWMHALHYTKPREQKHIIRILFMVPIYATSSWLQLRFYWHAIYFQVITDCYEAFAISSFFALLCHYVAPDVHEQKEFFRLMQPVKPWVLPVNWFKACCGGERGPWRTPKSGLTWFNIIWIGIYHYCFIRVAMTITAVVTQYFGRYCESSNSPVFGHIWTAALDAVAVTVAMYCVIQFYVQLREPLAEHRPFLKVLAIKLVIFLSFWQSMAISVGTSSTVDIVHANEVLAYPDIKVGIPSLLLCFEMALFAILHLWAFPYRPYLTNSKPTFYPVPSPDSGVPPRENSHLPPAGGFLGIKAIWDAMNVWDIVKAFGRGIRWLFVGVKHRKEDISYQPQKESATGLDMDDMSPQKRAGDRLNADTAYRGHKPGGKSTDHLPIATEFRRSKFDMMYGAENDPSRGRADSDGVESAGLIANAQPNPSSANRRRDEPSPYRDGRYDPPSGPYYGAPGQAEWEAAAGSPTRTRNPRDPAQSVVGEALWGPRQPQAQGGQIQPGSAF